MHFIGPISQLPGQRDYFRDDQFRNTARVTKRGIEDGNAMVRCIFNVDLIGSNAEAADDYEISRLLQYSGRQLRF